MKIGIFGGAFDPITNAHAFIAETTSSLFDELWLIPTGVHAHGKKVALIDHRRAMNRLAVCGSGNVKCPDLADNGTFLFLKELIARYPEHSFSLVIGQDNADNIKKWNHYQDLLELVPFVVVSRPKANKSPLVAITDWLKLCYKRPWYYKRPHKFVVNHSKVSEISSTDIRNRVRAGQSIAKLVPPPVEEYISQHRLYLEH